MIIGDRVRRQILLFSLVLIIVPMVIFPERFGTDLAKASLINALYELVFFGIVIFFFNRKASLLQLAQAAGVCLIYRLLLGAAFGVLAAVAYSMSLKVSLALGMSSYLPSIILHIVAAPFVLKPVISQIYKSQPIRRAPVHDFPPGDKADTGTTTLAVSRDKGFKPSTTPIQPEPETIEIVSTRAPVHTAKPLSTAAAAPGETNGFDMATKYIGENGSVHLAVVVDSEGLILSQFSRGEIVVEEWAPLALIFREDNGHVLGRVGWDNPERVELNLRDQKIVVAGGDHFNLMVVAELLADDVLNIRINQGLETIKKYIADRYGKNLAVSAERSYVSSTQ